MGLLDELENEAQRRKSEEDGTIALKASRESAYRTTLEPAMGGSRVLLTRTAADVEPVLDAE